MAPALAGPPIEIFAPPAAGPSAGASPPSSRRSSSGVEERDSAEVTRIGSQLVAPESAEAANWAFDVTPHDLVTAIVTEAGVLEPPYDRSIAEALGASQSPA